MATMFSEVYDAFVGAGASQDKARKAAEAVASYESRFSGAEQKSTKLEGRVDLLTWMVGANIALSIAVLVRLLIV
jgi:hypothetical protein